MLSSELGHPALSEGFDMEAALACRSAKMSSPWTPVYCQVSVPCCRDRQCCVCVGCGARGCVASCRVSVPALRRRGGGGEGGAGLCSVTRDLSVIVATHRAVTVSVKIVCETMCCDADDGRETGGGIGIGVQARM